MRLLNCLRSMAFAPERRSLAAAAACLAVVACSTPEVTAPDAAGDVPADAKAEVTADAADAGPPRVLKWAVYPTGSAAKVRAVAAIPGKSGQYIAVGDAANVWHFDDTAVSNVAPTSVGTSTLRGVWVAPSGTVFVAGDGSALLRRDAKGWELAGEVPPTVQFSAVTGVSDNDAWAVGSDLAAWKFDGTVWQAQAVSPTDAPDGAALTPDADFTCAFARGGDVWLGASVGSAGVVLHGSGGSWTAWALTHKPAAIWASEPVAALGGKPRVFVVGGDTTAFVAIREDKGFVAQTNGQLQWQLGFTGVSGIGGTVWATALKGQLRRWQDGAWSIDLIKSPPGTKPSAEVNPGSANLIGVAIHGVDERVVVTASQIFRWGKQP